jgi:hypothetical protein
MQFNSADDARAMMSAGAALDKTSGPRRPLAM